MFEIKEVKWRDIKGHEGLYQVSDNGWVKSLNYRGTGREKILKQAINSKGYLEVRFKKDGKNKKFKVSRLVAEAFITNPEGKPQVNHINENKLKNTVDNLNWMTAKENINYGTRNIRVADKNSKPVIATKNGIDQYFESGKQAAEELGLFTSSISDCLKGRHKTCGGYTFKYANS